MKSIGKDIIKGYEINGANSFSVSKPNNSHGVKSFDSVLKECQIQSIDHSLPADLTPEKIDSMSERELISILPLTASILNGLPE